MRRLSEGIGILFFIILVTGGVWVSLGHSRNDPVEWIKEMEGQLAQVDNYTVIFHKVERIKGRLKEEEVILLKFKKPFKVYMKWIGIIDQGREVVYVKGWNNNRIKVRGTGILGLIDLSIDPRSSLAMGGSRHPITEAGLENLVNVIGKHVRKGIVAGELEVRETCEEKVYGRMTRGFQIVFPKDERKNYYCYKAILNLDVEKKVPLNVQIFDRENLLVERYGYEDLKLNAGLTDADFSLSSAPRRFGGDLR